MKNIISQFFLLILLMSVVFACHERPKWFHPNAETSFKIQAERVALAMVDACKANDELRFLSYVSSQYKPTVSPKGQKPIDLISCNDIKEFENPPEFISSCTKYELEDLRYNYNSEYRTLVDSMAEDEIMVVVEWKQSKPTGESQTVERLILFFSKSDAGWIASQGNWASQ